MTAMADLGLVRALKAPFSQWAAAWAWACLADAAPRRAGAPPPSEPVVSASAAILSGTLTPQRALPRVLSLVLCARACVVAAEICCAAATPAVPSPPVSLSAVAASLHAAHGGWPAVLVAGVLRPAAAAGFGATLTALCALVASSGGGDAHSGLAAAHCSLATLLAGVSAQVLAAGLARQHAQALVESRVDEVGGEGGPRWP